MITPSPRNDKGHARRLLVTLVITTAAAAVTAGVVLKTHRPAEAVVQRAATSPMLAGAQRPCHARGGSPRRVAGSLEAADAAVRIGIHVDQRRARRRRDAV